MSATLITVGSGSSGNNYIVRVDNEVLILEAGVPFKECATVLNYDLKEVVGCCVTHAHKDHSAYIKQYQQHGLPVYSNSDVADAFIGVIELKPMQKYHFGGFTVIGLEVPHGYTPNMAYVIDHPSFGRLCFITDAERFPYQLQGINTLMIECNYSDDIRIDAMLNGAELRAQSRNHMELGETIATIKRLKSSELSSVILLHLSDALSDSEGFKRAIREQCGVNAEVADKNKVFVLQKEEFLTKFAT